MLEWLRKKRIQGEAIDLVIEYVYEPRYEGESKNICYGIFSHNGRNKVGECDLRVGMNEELYYAGNIGYRVYEPYRRKGYAYEACKLLFATARQTYRMKELIITCSPDNTASRALLEKLGGELLETSEVPKNHWLYRRGETVKNIYKYYL